MNTSTDAGQRALVERLRELLAKATPLPWRYRPEESDDWGFIRGGERSEFGYPIVAVGRGSHDDHDEHRRNGTDPYGPNSELIVEAINALPTLLAAFASPVTPAAAVDREAVARQLYAWSPCILEESIGCDGPGSCKVATWEQVADVVRNKFREQAAILALTPAAATIPEGMAGDCAAMFPLIQRIWDRYNKDDEPDEGWSKADEDVMELLGWNHTLYNLSHPDEDTKRAHELIRRAAELIKPGKGEVIFELRVSADHTQLTTHSAPDVEPQAALAKAIEALCAESQDAANCPVHANKSPIPPATIPGGDREAVSVSLDAALRSSKKLNGWISAALTSTGEASDEVLADAGVSLGYWLSAALDDPSVCDAMKADINAWFAAGMPPAANPVTVDAGGVVAARRELQGYVDRRRSWSSRSSMMSIPQPVIERVIAALSTPESTAAGKVVDRG
jgi:hypothetical protein